MKYIFNALDAIKKEMSGKELYLFLDYDGTLTPIVDHPQHAALPAPTKKLLKEFIKQPHCKVSIVTGRALSDIRRVIGMQHITYIGNHGFEIDDPKVSFKGFDLTHTREILEYLKWQINKELVFFKGAFIEDKGICLCIHYRQLQEGQTEPFKALLHEIVVPFYLKNEIYIEIDKKVFEIKPSFEWDKGKAVLWLLNAYKKHVKGDILPVYIGDSMTDEYAFKALTSRGITVRVGRSDKSLSQYYIKDQNETNTLLSLLLKSTAKKG